MTHGFKKAVVWGCPLHQHTNSYVYAGFYKAFKAMGFDASWLNEDSDVSGMDFSNTLFLTEWQHAGNMPRRKDCKYVLHNCDPKDYEGMDVLHLQVYTTDCTTGTCVHGAIEHLKHGLPDKINEYGSWLADDDGKRTLIQPWATDLLPHEIDLSWAEMPRQRETYWVGTLGTTHYPEDVYSNLNEVENFMRACEENGIPFIHKGPGSCSFEENKSLIQRSYMAPAILSTEHCRVGCVTCRVFKNISYGQMAGTNSRAASGFFPELVFNEDTYSLFYDIDSRREDTEAVKSLMKLVRDRHTYVNRISTILEVL